MNNTTNITEEDTEVIQTFASRLFWIIFFCSVSIVSLIVFYFYFYHLFQRRQSLLYKKLNNHTLLCLLITDYLLIQTELPFTIAFLMRNRVIVDSKKFCIFRNYWYYIWTTMSIQFSMLTAINRYLLVFHKAFLMKNKMLCHYLPMICIWLYIPCLHLYFIVFFPYGNTTFDFHKIWCGGPQFIFVTFYVTYDSLFNTFIPIVILVIFNLIITMRVIFLKKVAANSANKWKKNRRMILQTFGICCSQLVGGVPYCVVTLGVIYNSPSFGLDIYTQALIYTFYIPSLFSPVFALVTMPKEVRDKLLIIFKCSKENQYATKGKTTDSGAGPSTRDQCKRS